MTFRNFPPCFRNQTSFQVVRQTGCRYVNKPESTSTFSDHMALLWVQSAFDLTRLPIALQEHLP